jgi:hypothetical protein
MNLIYPVLAQIGWTLIILFMMGAARYRSVKSRETRIGQVALGNDAWPDRIKAISNNFTNQFETPVLFYALCAIGIYVGATGWFISLLAWIYVASRVVHTLIHSGANNVLKRFQVFALGSFALLGMFATILITLL